jgi:hypothetical protein
MTISLDHVACRLRINDSFQEASSNLWFSCIAWRVVDVDCSSSVPAD